MTVSTLGLVSACEKSGGTYLLWLSLLLLRQQLVAQRALERAAQTENAVVRLLWREALDGCEDDFGLLWDQVIGSVLALASILVYFLKPAQLIVLAQLGGE